MIPTKLLSWQSSGLHMPWSPYVLLQQLAIHGTTEICLQRNIQGNMGIKSLWRETTGIQDTSQQLYSTLTINTFFRVGLSCFYLLDDYNWDPRECKLSQLYMKVWVNYLCWMANYLWNNMGHPASWTKTWNGTSKYAQLTRWDMPSFGGGWSRRL